MSMADDNLPLLSHGIRMNFEESSDDNEKKVEHSGNSFRWRTEFLGIILVVVTAVCHESSNVFVQALDRNIPIFELMIFQLTG